MVLIFKERSGLQLLSIYKEISTEIESKHLEDCIANNVVSISKHVIFCLVTLIFFYFIKVSARNRGRPRVQEIQR